MKKLLSLVLALTMLLSLPLSALAEEDDIVIILPVMENLVNATFDAAASQENNVFCYSSATQEDVDYFLALSSFFGIYAIDARDLFQSTAPIYLLVMPGTDFEAMLFFSEADGVLMFDTDYQFHPLDEETLLSILALFAEDLKLPAGATSNSVPQFYHCVGKAYNYANNIGGVDYIFDGSLCWTEYYDEITLDMLNNYTLLMNLFGYEVILDRLDTDENGYISYVLLHYTNGDGELLVEYNANQEAAVHYEPGISWFMPSAAQLQEILGQ